MRRRLRSDVREHSDTVLRLQPAELHETAPFAPGDDRFVAELASPASGRAHSSSVRRAPPPAWIVLDYADGQQRRWRRARRAGDRHFFTLAEDTASAGYITTVA